MTRYFQNRVLSYGGGFFLHSNAGKECKKLVQDFIKHIKENPIGRF